MPFLDVADWKWQKENEHIQVRTKTYIVYVLVSTYMCLLHTLVETAETDTEVETEDSELADSDSGDPGRLIFLRFRGRPFNLGAVK